MQNFAKLAGVSDMVLLPLLPPFMNDVRSAIPFQTPAACAHTYGTVSPVLVVAPSKLAPWREKTDIVPLASSEKTNAESLEADAPSENKHIVPETVRR